MRWNGMRAWDGLRTATAILPSRRCRGAVPLTPDDHSQPNATVLLPPNRIAEHGEVLTTMQGGKAPELRAVPIPRAQRGRVSTVEADRVPGRSEDAVVDEQRTHMVVVDALEGGFECRQVRHGPSGLTAFLRAVLRLRDPDGAAAAVPTSASSARTTAATTDGLTLRMTPPPRRYGQCHQRLGTTQVASGCESCVFVVGYIGSHAGVHQLREQPPDRHE